MDRDDVRGRPRDDGSLFHPLVVNSGADEPPEPPEPPPTPRRPGPPDRPGRRSARPAPAMPRSSRDWMLLVLLAALNLGSLYTTVIGARQVLPQPMSDVLGVAVQTMLFFALAGFAIKHSRYRKAFVVAVFAAASIYTSVFAYYEQLAGHANQSATVDRAHQSHAQFVSALYQPQLGEVDRLTESSRSLFALAEREGSSGVTTGVVGFGPVAREYAEQARQAELQAAQLSGDLQRVASRYEYALDGLGAGEIYRRDLEAWQLTPDDWKATVPAPERGAYLDLEQEVALLTPWWKIRRGELPAIAALLLALLVDGIAILMGTAIHRRRQPLLESATRGTVDWIERAKDSGAAVRAALGRPGVAEGQSVPDAGDLDASLHGIALRIEGRGSDFLALVYQAIHPETGAVDFATLQAHPNGSWRLASRMLADRLRSPRIGWLVVDEGYWAVPPEHYVRVTSWLSEHLRHEAEAEAVEQEADAVERTLRLVLPAA